MIGVATPVFAGDNIPEVKKSGNFYYSQIGFNMYYHADPIAGICYLSQANVAFTVVDCKSLKKRPEWSKIITWVK